MGKYLSFTRLLRGASTFCRRSPYVACQRPVAQQQRPIVPSVFAPPDMLVYSVSRLTSTGEVPLAVRPVALQSDSPPGLLEPRPRPPLIVHAVRQGWLVGSAVAGPGSPRLLENSVLCPARSATIFDNPGNNLEF